MRDSHASCELGILNLFNLHKILSVRLLDGFIITGKNEEATVEVVQHIHTLINDLEIQRSQLLTYAEIRV